MKEPYEKGVASHLGLESYADDGNVVGVALAKGTRRPAMELHVLSGNGASISRADLVLTRGRQHLCETIWQVDTGRGGV